MKSQYSMPTHHLVLFNTPVSGKLSPQKGISRISPYSKETQLPRLQRDAELNKALSTLSPPSKSLDQRSQEQAHKIVVLLYEEH